VGRTICGECKVEILQFELYGQRYGIPVADADEILRAVAITPLPNAPRIIEGVIDIRGTVTPVLDIRARFGMPAKQVEIGDHLIVARAGPRRVVIRADQVQGLVGLSAGDIADIGSVTTKIEHVSGVAKLPDGLIILHDLQSFLSEAENEALDSSMGAAAS
jgi:purine-binding chemotaxis protein CheW